jgi:NADH:ubiquinone reductase (H+-translocating)
MNILNELNFIIGRLAMSIKIVVLGAGYAGILTAKKLEKKLKKHDVEITIIDKNPFHTMLTELHEVAAWRVEEESIRISLSRVFAGRNVKVLTDVIVSTDFDSKVVLCESGSYEYDYLVLATGSTPTFYGLSAIKEHVFTLWSYNDAIKIREHIMQMFRRASTERNMDEVKKLLTFYVVGAGFTGVEMIGELAELVPVLCAKFEIDKSLVKLRLVDAMDTIITSFPEKLSSKALRKLEKMNVETLLNTKIVSAGPDYIDYYKDRKTQRDLTYTFIWTAGIQASELSSNSESLGLVKDGRVQTDEYLRSKNYNNVYVAGDSIFYIPEGSTQPVPQMVENCETSAATVAKNIVADITKSNKQEKYTPKFHGAMLCIGGRYGIAHIGTDKVKVGLPSFLAMLAKHFINIIYFVQVLGWNKVFSYLRHEIFTIRNKRSFVGGHFSNRTPSFLIVPFRLFLGFYWIYEAYVKILEGWLDTPHLKSFFSGANSFYDNLLNGAVVDAVTSATEVVVETANPILINWDILGLMRIILVNSGKVVALKIQMPMADAMINGFVLPSPDIQIVFQTVVVFAEILVGLALMGGLLTSFAAAFSIFLQMLFLTSTGLYMSTWWMGFGAIIFLIGGGSSFGLDYYVMPILKKYWRKIGFVKKWYIYND